METIKFTIHTVFSLSFALLAVTGILPYMNGEPLSGYVLLLHVMVSPLFLLSLLLLTLSVVQPFISWITKSCFWLMLFFAIPLTLSMIGSMFPLFDTAMLESLILCHVSNAIAFTLSSILFYYSLFLDRNYVP